MAKYQPVGVCIYCLSDGAGDGLRDEHIVPFSLGGTGVLPKSSCKKCEGITSAFERRLARTMYGRFRIRYQVPTRRKKSRPSHLPADTLAGGEKRVQDLPEGELPLTLPQVRFLPPGILCIPPRYEPHWTGSELILKFLGVTAETADRTGITTSVSVNQGFDVDSLARTLAKIAHATAVAEFGVGAFDHWLTPYILGSNPNLSYLVGGDPSLSDDAEHTLHNVKWRAGPAMIPYFGVMPLITVQIRLFAQLGGPHALIVVGTTDYATILKREELQT